MLSFHPGITFKRPLFIIWCRYNSGNFAVLKKLLNFLFFFILRERREVSDEGGGCKVLNYLQSYFSQ